MLGVNVQSEWEVRGSKRFVRPSTWALMTICYSRVRRGSWGTILKDEFLERNYDKRIAAERLRNNCGCTIMLNYSKECTNKDTKQQGNESDSVDE